MNIPNCPVCGKNDRTIEIIYGMPNQAIRKRAEKGEVKLGGCIIKESPRYFCKRDNHEF